MEKDGATGGATLAELPAETARPHAIWLMVSAAAVAGLEALMPHLDPGDIVVDRGNSYYRDDIRGAATGRHYVDVGTSGGVAGLERGLLPDDRRRDGNLRPPGADGASVAGPSGRAFNSAAGAPWAPSAKTGTLTTRGRSACVCRRHAERSELPCCPAAGTRGDIRPNI